MVKLSSLGPLILLFPPLSGERVEEVSRVKPERGLSDMSESSDGCRRRGLGEEGAKTSPGKALEMNK